MGQPRSCNVRASKACPVVVKPERKANRAESACRAQPEIRVGESPLLRSVAHKGQG